ncbi:type II toxin-antitoxin system RelE/ParE family toxin [Mangrovivirga cuniculi]|uniref:Type II toxin-antitoxin system RelE/ParE family toxin n=1 Tax=Mangrovivirga cuniculi TaxID=2715131 RepID=A0A4D7JHG5_9BACT|nr:type II toxin-antitoxin system RelE/ParE family toxin [Mangrovivirga cuniculi]QCK14483.1 hypothetical protein DCC35_06880 [Mangrovivirga cuniculi]
MTYNYRFSEEAESDIYDSYLWYEKQRSGLGEEFLKELENAARAIISNPTTYRIRFKKKVRVFVVNRFPYLILYIVNGGNIDAISVFNTNQDSKKWKKRVK